MYWWTLWTASLASSPRVGAGNSSPISTGTAIAIGAGILLVAGLMVYGFISTRRKRK